MKRRSVETQEAKPVNRAETPEERTISERSFFLGRITETYKCI